MLASIDIENSQTRKVSTLEVPIIEFKERQDVRFDVSKLTATDLELLANAIDDTMPHTDIELFFTDSEPGIPNFGPDYQFELNNNELIGKYTRDEWLKKRREKNGR